MSMDVHEKPTTALFYPDKGGIKMFWNVAKYLPAYMASNPT
jgi:hypothetical protein